MSGYTVFAGVRKAADGEAALAECEQSHGKAACSTLVPVILDVTKAETIESTHAMVAAWVEKHKQPLVAVVNNAGISGDGPFEMLSLDYIRRGLFLRISSQ